MYLKYSLLFGAGLLGGSALVHSLNVNNPNRRTFINKAIVSSGIVTASTLIGENNIKPVFAADDSNNDPYSDFVTTESGLKYKVIKEGTGTEPPAIGARVITQYTGWLDGFDTVRKFDSSRDRNKPFTFDVGKGQVIRGWDESFSNMVIGERRQIIIPPRLGYGDRGAGGIIPGGATLYFDVELIGIGK